MATQFKWCIRLFMNGAPSLVVEKAKRNPNACEGVPGPAKKGEGSIDM